MQNLNFESLENNESCAKIDAQNTRDDAEESHAREISTE